MQPGPNEIVQCPSCGTFQRRRTLLSGNTLNAKYYSDGSRKAPMLPSFPYFIKCPECSVFFKLSSEVIVKKVPWAPEPDEWTMDIGAEVWDTDLDDLEIVKHRKGKTAPKVKGADAPFVKFLDVKEYWQAIEIGLVNSGRKNSKTWKEDILAMRILLWRTLNIRWQMDEEEKKIYDENCRAILDAIIDKLDDENLITRAEVHRNLGEFDECASLLDKIKEPEKYEYYLSAIGKACKAGDTLTVCVQSNR